MEVFPFLFFYTLSLYIHQEFTSQGADEGFAFGIEWEWTLLMYVLILDETLKYIELICILSIALDAR